MPDSPLYKIKRLEEKVFAKFLTNPSSQLSYDKTLLSNRLREIQYLVDNREYHEFYMSSLRYSTTAGDIANLIFSRNMNSEKKKTVTMFKDQQNEIKKLIGERDAYNKLVPVKDERGEWGFLQDDINYLTIYMKKLSPSHT